MVIHLFVSSGTWDEILTELSSHRSWSKLHPMFCKDEEDEFDEESLQDPIPTLGKERRQFWQDLVLLGDAQNCHVWSNLLSHELQ